MTRERKPPEPTRDEVLKWLGLTGKTPMEAVDHFWPKLSDADRSTRCARVRKWVQRTRRGEIVVRDGPEPLDAKSLPKPALAPKPVTEDEDRISFLRRQLRDLEQDIADARSEDQKRLIPQLSKRLSEVREEYDQAMERERRIVRLARTPAAISAELVRRAEAIALRAELWRRRVEREAAAKKRATKVEEGG